MVNKMTPSPTAVARRNSLAAVLGMLVYLVGTPVKVCIHVQFKHSCQLVPTLRSIYKHNSALMLFKFALLLSQFNTYGMIICPWPQNIKFNEIVNCSAWMSKKQN